MAERGKTRRMAQLLDVQRARRGGAEAALAAAAAKTAAARTDERSAAARSASAEAEWLEQLSAGGFAPEYCRVLAGRLVDREDEARTAALQLRAAEELQASRDAEWRRLEAQTRGGEISLRRARRREARRLEEHRLAELADRTTRAWRRP